MQKRIREQVQQRSRMLGAVSHDLRTPLSRLKLRLEQIDDIKLQGQMRQDLDDMIRMLDATLSYLHEQRTSEALQWMDVQALIESLCENAQDQGADVQASGHCAPLQVQPMALRSCINNLLDNSEFHEGLLSNLDEVFVVHLRVSHRPKREVQPTGDLLVEKAGLGSGGSRSGGLPARDAHDAENSYFHERRRRDKNAVRGGIEVRRGNLQSVIEERQQIVGHNAF